MYTFSRAERLGKKLSPKLPAFAGKTKEYNLKFSLSQYVKILAISQEAKAKSLMDPCKY